MTHLLQPLDLTLFKSVKSLFARLAHCWQGEHAGDTLGKYIAVKIFRAATEKALKGPSIITIL